MTKSIEEVDTEVDHLRNRVDTIEEKAEKERAPLYKNIPTIISTLAFIVSLGTTTVSYFRTQQQDVHNLRAELRGILQRLAALGKEQLEFYIGHKGDMAAINALSRNLNQENLILSVQAHEILRRLPADQLSAIDYYTVGQALLQSRRYDDGRFDITRATETASGLDDSVAALRTLAQLDMTTGRSEGARHAFQQALDIFGRFPGFDDFTRTSTHIQTRLGWAASEAGVRNYTGASAQLDEAETLANTLPRGAQGDYWRSQVVEYKQQLATLRSDPAASAALPATVNSGGMAPGGLTPAPQPPTPGQQPR